MVGLNGYLTSSSTNLSGTNGLTDNFSNNFFYNLNGSYFLKSRLSIGLFVGMSRTSSEELLIRETEGFVTGSGIRYYLSKNQEGSLYFQGSVFYSRFYDRSAIIDIVNPIDNILTGSGIGGNIGLGYSYVIKDMIILEIGFDNNFSWFSGEITNQITNSKSKQNFSQYELNFNFGLSILIGTGIKK